MNVNSYISALVQYGLDKELFEPCDKAFIINQLISSLQLSSYEPVEPSKLALEVILQGLLEDAVERGIIGEDITSRDLLDTKLMGILTPPPREVRAKFASLYMQDARKATDWFYQFSQDTDYIRRYRIKKGHTLEDCYGIRQSRCYDQFEQTGKRPQSNRRSESCTTIRLSKVPALRRE